jgi:hypothetical protein
LPGSAKAFFVYTSIAEASRLFPNNKLLSQYKRFEKRKLRSCRPKPCLVGLQMPGKFPPKNIVGLAFYSKLLPRAGMKAIFSIDCNLRSFKATAGRKPLKVFLPAVFIGRPKHTACCEEEQNLYCCPA